MCEREEADHAREIDMKVARSSVQDALTGHPASGLFSFLLTALPPSFLPAYLATCLPSECPTFLPTFRTLLPPSPFLQPLRFSVPRHRFARLLRITSHISASRRICHPTWHPRPCPPSGHPGSPSSSLSFARPHLGPGERAGPVSRPGGPADRCMSPLVALRPPLSSLEHLDLSDSYDKYVEIAPLVNYACWCRSHVIRVVYSARSHPLAWQRSVHTQTCMSVRVYQSGTSADW